MIHIVAECCQNHNGDVDRLIEMVEQAAKSGATHIKMQTIFAHNVVYRPEHEISDFDDVIYRPYSSEFSRMQGLEIDLDGHRRFVQACNANNVVPITTVFARDQIPFVRSAGFNSVKVASYDCASYPLLRELNIFDQIFMSTGATYDSEIEYAVKLVKDKLACLFHCITIYPTPLESCNMHRLKFLSKLFPVVGFSDHSDSRLSPLLASKIAIFLGSSYIERHFSILPTEATKDGPVSVNPDDIKELISFSYLSSDDQLAALAHLSSDWSSALGSELRALSKTELLNRGYFRGRFGSPRSSISPLSLDRSSWILNYEECPLP